MEFVVMRIEQEYVFFYHSGNSQPDMGIVATLRTSNYDFAGPLVGVCDGKVKETIEFYLASLNA
jgi:hypothetical protein